MRLRGTINDGRRDVERLVSERFVSSADKDPIVLAAILRALWREIRGQRGRDALAVREQIRRRMRWELAVRAREDAEDGVIP